MTASPVCRCATCGRQFAFIEGATSTTACYFCHHDTLAPRHDAQRIDDEGEVAHETQEAPEAPHGFGSLVRDPGERVKRALHLRRHYDS